MTTEASSLSELARRIHGRINDQANGAVRDALRKFRVEVPEQISEALAEVCGPQIRCVVGPYIAAAIDDIEEQAVRDLRKLLTDRILDSLERGESVKPS